MLISSRFSKSKKFLFLHVYKTAGSSVRRAFYQYASSSQILLQLFNHILKRSKSPITLRRKIYDYHPTAKDIIDEIGFKKYSEYFSFAFSRNPLSHQLSLFRYSRINKDLKKCKFFDDYLNARIDQNLDLQSEFTHHAGRKLVNYIAKFENLKSELEIISKKLEIPQLTLKHTNKSKNLTNSVILKKETFNKFVSIYDNDYRLLNYSKTEIPNEIIIQ